MFDELLEEDVISRLLLVFVSLLETKGIEPEDVSTRLLSLSDPPDLSVAVNVFRL